MSSSEISSKPIRNKRTKYQKINQNLRKQIIDRLCVKKQGLRQVANLLNINHSTCKAIVKVYQNQGRIGKKKTRNKNVDVIETFTFCIVDKSNYEQIPQVKIFESKISCDRFEKIDDILINKSKIKGQQLGKQIMEARKKINGIWNNQNIHQNVYPTWNYSYPQFFIGGNNGYIFPQ